MKIWGTVVCDFDSVRLYWYVCDIDSMGYVVWNYDSVWGLTVWISAGDMMTLLMKKDILSEDVTR